jgi:hypothetical protein
VAGDLYRVDPAKLDRASHARIWALLD